jgi:hypothetical protein
MNYIQICDDESILFANKNSEVHWYENTAFSRIIDLPLSAFVQLFDIDLLQVYHLGSNE